MPGAAAMARSLPRDVGVAVSGLVLVSPALSTAILHRRHYGNGV